MSNQHLQAKMAFQMCNFRKGKYGTFHSRYLQNEVVQDGDMLKLSGTEKVNVAVKDLLLFLKILQADADVVLPTRIGHLLSNFSKFIILE